MPRLLGRLPQRGQHLFGHRKAGEQRFAEYVFNAEVHQAMGVTTVTGARNDCQVGEVADYGFSDLDRLFEIGNGEYQDCPGLADAMDLLERLKPLAIGVLVLLLVLMIAGGVFG